MNTEIFKADSEIDDIPAFFCELSTSVVTNGPCQVTVIVNSNTASIKEHKNISNSTGKPIEVRQEKRQEDKEESQEESEDSGENRSSFFKVTTLKTLQTNSRNQTQKIHIEEPVKGEIICSKQHMKIYNERQIQNNQALRLQVYQTEQPDSHIQQLKIQHVNHEEAVNKNLSQKVSQNEQIKRKIKKPTFQQDSNSQIESEISQRGALIENKLNSAVSFLASSDLMALEDFLFEFKQKYSQLTPRAQIKWYLLMARCKDSKLQHERAATNYTKILELLALHEDILSVSESDIHHRLGICYLEIQEWNKGIASFTKALKHYRINYDSTKYAQCLNNLGTLYLKADQINQAERCFLSCYDIMKQSSPASTPKNFMTLFNLLECNYSLKNYLQAEMLITAIENMFKGAEQQSVLYGSFLRRKAKLPFMKGNLDLAEKYVNAAIIHLKSDSSRSVDYGQALALLGLIQLERQNYYQSKRYFRNALRILGKYYGKESKTMQTIKSNFNLAMSLSDKAQKAQKYGQ